MDQLNDKNREQEQIPALEAENNNQNDSNYTKELKKQSLINENMEIHHSHGGHPKKTLKDYIFEFFMLFLAVTAGFFVENEREKYIEHHREKQYIESLLRDLSVDTANMSRIITATRMQMKGIDSLLKVIENPKSPTYINDVYYYSLHYANRGEFHVFNEGTVTQLKNAGGLRLIRKQISDSIIKYYNMAENVLTNNEYGYEQLKKVIDREKKIFNFRMIRISKKDLDPNKKSDLTFLDHPSVEQDFFYNDIVTYLSQLGNCTALLIKQKEQSKNLIDFVKKEYNLE